MTSLGQTPAPWEVGDEDSFGFPIFYRARGNIRVLVGRVEKKGNAHLISATPDLRKDLDNMVEAFLALGGREDAACVVSARATLAKARGRNSEGADDA